MAQNNSKIRRCWIGLPNWGVCCSVRTTTCSANRRDGRGEQFGGVIYSHQLRITVGQAIRDLEVIAQVYEPSDMENRVEYLPL